MASKSQITITKNRLLILEAVRNLANHPSADDIHAYVKKEIPDLSLGTVYRNLDILARHGFIKRIEFGNSKARYDHLTNDHHHVRCIGCGRIDDIPANINFEIDELIGHNSDIEIIDYDLELLGYCKECRNKKEEQ